MLTKVAPGIATLTTNLLIGRLGGAPLLGLTQTAISTAALTSLAYPGPAASAASRFVSASVAAEEPEKAAAVASYLARRVLVAIACLIVLILGGSLLFKVDSIVVVVVSCVMTAGISLRVFVEGLHFGGGQGRRLAIWSVVVAGVGIAGSALLLVAGNRTAWVIVPVAVANMVFALVTWPPSSSVSLEPSERKVIRHFILIAALGTLASAGFVQLTTLVANITAGVTFAGEYAAGLTLTTPLAILATAISATLFPALSAMQVGASREVVRHRITEASSILTWLIGAAVCGMIIVSELLVDVVWGKDYPNTWWILLFLLMGTLATTVAVPSVTALTSSSNRGMLISAGSSFLGAIAGTVAWVILIPIAGELGVMIGCAVATVLTGLVPYAIIWKRWGMRWGRSTVELIAMVAVSVSLAMSVRLGYVDILLSPVLAVAVVALWVLLRRRDVRSVWTIVASMRGRK
ncbi:lipopolysaccharide biosynthesis protein [Microbacterium sp. MYb66]|uniref:lipopolysaccharide biosynthesis protein n=1 Tax=Microbacterium sp. MYb66 TaxID=1848692 RepID=UPI000CFE9A06|nr:hypothetical protein [Microbacterium sp. MYb66]PRA81983.1 hypothetical protein CQ045_04560 [Microbacterium sp. MYb66]